MMSASLGMYLVKGGVKAAHRTCHDLGIARVIELSGWSLAFITVVQNDPCLFPLY